MASTIIVPLDGSKTAEEALPHAREIASRQESQLLLLSVVQITSEFNVWAESAALNIEDELEQWVEERRAYLQQLATDLPNAEVAVEIGTPTVEIRAAVARSDNPIVVIASHGRSGIQQVVMGSVAFSVIHQVHCPVMVVRIQPDGGAAPAARYDRVLFPIDGEEFSEQIIERALDVISEPKPAVHFMSVLEVPDWADRSLSHGLVGDYMNATRELANERLDWHANRLQPIGYQVTTEVRDGDVTQNILDCAEAIDAGLIAMATHGRGDIGRALIGSVAQRVVHRSPVPVLLIHPESE